MRQDRQAQQIRQALERLDAEAAPHDLPGTAEAWSRLQFRLAYRARKDDSTLEAGSLLVALYVLAFLIWTTWCGWLSAAILAAVATIAAAAMILSSRLSRSFRN